MTLSVGRELLSSGLDTRLKNVVIKDFDAVWDQADELHDVLPIYSLTEPERRELVSHMSARRLGPAEVAARR